MHGGPGQRLPRRHTQIPLHHEADRCGSGGWVAGTGGASSCLRCMWRALACQRPDQRTPNAAHAELPCRRGQIPGVVAATRGEWPFGRPEPQLWGSDGMYDGIANKVRFRELYLQGE